MSTQNLLSLSILTLTLSTYNKNNNPNSNKKNITIILFNKNISSTNNNISSKTKNINQPNKNLKINISNKNTNINNKPNITTPEDMNNFPSSYKNACAIQDLTTTYKTTTKPFERTIYNLNTPKTTTNKK